MRMWWSGSTFWPCRSHHMHTFFSSTIWIPYCSLHLCTSMYCFVVILCRCVYLTLNLLGLIFALGITHSVCFSAVNLHTSRIRPYFCEPYFLHITVLRNAILLKQSARTLTTVLTKGLGSKAIILAMILCGLHFTECADVAVGCSESVGLLSGFWTIQHYHRYILGWELEGKK